MATQGFVVLARSDQAEVRERQPRDGLTASWVSRAGSSSRSGRQGAPARECSPRRAPWHVGYVGAPSRMRRRSIGFVFGSLTKLLGTAVSIFLAAGLADLLIQRWIFLRDMRMTQTEAKRELKDQEGSPQIRGAHQRHRREAATETRLGVARATLIVKGRETAAGLRYVRGKPGFPSWSAAAGPTPRRRSSMPPGRSRSRSSPMPVSPGTAARVRLEAPVPSRYFERIAKPFGGRHDRVTAGPSLRAALPRVRAGDARRGARRVRRPGVRATGRAARSPSVAATTGFPDEVSRVVDLQGKIGEIGAAEHRIEIVGVGGRSDHVEVGTAAGARGSGPPEPGPRTAPGTPRRRAPGGSWLVRRPPREPSPRPPAERLDGPRSP